MTTRQRVIATAAVKAERAIRREAEINGEQVHEITRKAVRDHVEDCIGIDSRWSDEWSATRVINAVIRQVEDYCDVRRGWWS